MLFLGAIGGVAFILASLLVGIRLLLLARRTRALPELLVGSGLLAMGALGLPLSTAARAMSDAPALQAKLFAAHALLTLLGQGTIAVFTWHVFRREERWARNLAVGFIAGLGLLALAQTLSPGWQSFAHHEGGPWTLLPIFSLSVLAWAGFEALHYHGLLARRLALGLADPVTTDRLRLWSISILASLVISVTAAGLRAAGVAMTPTVVGLVVGPLGLISASAMYLAFVPPRGYVRWIESRFRAARP